MNALSPKGFHHILWPIWPTRLGEDPISSVEHENWKNTKGILIFDITASFFVFSSFRLPRLPCEMLLGSLFHRGGMLLPLLFHWRVFVIVFFL
jgi:hypothetical protein